MNYLHNLYSEIAKEINETEGGLAAYLEEVKQGAPDHLIDKTLEPLELALEGGANQVPEWLPAAMGEMYELAQRDDNEGVVKRWQEIKGLLAISR